MHNKPLVPTRKGEAPLLAAQRRRWAKQRMPKRLKLSRVQRDIVFLLEEAGSETMRTVAATLKPPDPRSLDAEIEALVALGLVRKLKESETRDTELVLTDAGRAELSK